MKILSIDAETNGLHGQIFSIGAVYVDTTMGKAEQFIEKVSIVEFADPWVVDNVLPHLEGIEALDKTVDDDVYGTEKLLLKKFIEFYKECKEKAGDKLIVLGHMVCPVEANIFIKARNYGLMEDFDGPYPLHDVASMLLLLKEKTDSVDEYVKKCELKSKLNLNNFCKKPHNPLYDSEQAFKVFWHIINRIHR